jgi:hypothetical protein
MKYRNWTSAVVFGSRVSRIPIFSLFRREEFFIGAGGGKYT